MQTKPEDFLAAGYTKRKAPAGDTRSYYLHKMLDDELGIRYEIDVYVTELNKLKDWQQDDPMYKFEPEVLMHKGASVSSIKFIMDSRTTVEELEDFYLQMWVAIGKGYISWYD